MRQTHKRKIICSLKGKEISVTSASSALGCRGGGRPNKSHFHIYIQAVEINLKSHQERKRNKTQRKHQKGQLSNFQIHGALAISQRVKRRLFSYSFIKWCMTFSLLKEIKLTNFLTSPVRLLF